MQSVAGGIVWLVAMVLLMAGVLRLWPRLARAVLGADPPDRQSSLDGLRGVLALAVILHHGIIAHAYFGTGKWEAPPSNFDNLLGQGAVALFFMISAYLFWGRILRLGMLDWPAFYRGRFRRLVPMYAATVLLLFAIVAVETGFTLKVPVEELLKQYVRWSSFAFLDAGDLNGLPQTGTILSVIWTLRWEWLFYVTLPFFAAIYALFGRPWMFYGLVLVCAAGFGELKMALYFVTGGIAVHAIGRWRESILARRVVGSLGIVALPVCVVFFHGAYDPGPALLLFPVFVAALLGWGPWAVLSWRPLRFLGHISYSVYLLHNPLIHLAGRYALGPERYSHLDPVELYGVLVGVGIVTIALSIASYLTIEKPFLHSKG